MRLFGMTVYFYVFKASISMWFGDSLALQIWRKKTIQIEFCAKFIAKIGDRKKFTCLLQNFIYSSIKE